MFLAACRSELGNTLEIVEYALYNESEEITEETVGTDCTEKILPLPSLFTETTINPTIAQAFTDVISDRLPFTFFGFVGSPFSDWMSGSDLVWATPTFESLLFREYFEKSDVIYTWEIVSFAFVDLGWDGNMQLVLRSALDGDFLILHYMGGGVVYGFGIPSRQFQSLKIDGTFLQLSWMQDWGAIARLNFYPRYETRALGLIFLHEWDQSLHYNGLLFFDGGYVDFEEGWAIVENIRQNHESKESVIWHSFEELSYFLR